MKNTSSLSFDIPKGIQRNLNLSEIANLVKYLRIAFDWKQYTLAINAFTTERTIQRIEKGEKVNIGTLKKIAKAFDVNEQIFSEPIYIPTDAEIGHLKNEIINLHRVESLKNINMLDITLIDHCDSFVVHKYYNASASVETDFLKDVSILESDLQDYFDIKDLMDSVGRFENQESVFNFIKNMEQKHKRTFKYDISTRKIADLNIKCFEFYCIDVELKERHSTAKSKKLTEY